MLNLNNTFTWFISPFQSAFTANFSSEDKRREKYNVSSSHFSMECSKTAKDKPMGAGSQGLQKAQVYHPVLVNWLIREFIPPVPLAEGCAASSPSDVIWKWNGQPWAGTPPEPDESLLKGCSHSLQISYCSSSATSWSFSCIFAFLWVHFLAFFPFFPLLFT